MKWENTYLVFEVAKGPKVIIDTLNTYGVANKQIVCFLKRRTDVDEEPKVDKEEEKISKLWSNSGE